MRSTTLAALGMALAVPTLAAAQPVIGPYISLGAGADFLQNQDFRPQGPLDPNKRSYRFDVGPTGFVAAGYGFGNGFRVEIEGEYSNNHVRGVTYPQPLRAGGYEQQYGGFGNVLYDIPTPIPLPVTPYIGAGVGYQRVELDNVNSTLPGTCCEQGVYEGRGSFAYQGIAGLSTPISFVPGLAMTAEYRLIGVTDRGAYLRGFADDGYPYHSTANNVFNHEVLIGMRYAFYTPPPPAPPAPPAPIAAPAPEPARTYLVFFDWDKADLTARARQIIADAAQASTHVQTTRIEVNGYTDLSGTAKYNMGLSVRRADAVAAELVRDGVNRDEISTQGFGESHPLVPTAAGVREPQNRRVEIILK